MTRKKLIPARKGGGVPQGEPTARINKHGVLSMSAATMQMLGNPPKLSVWIVGEHIEMEPTTATDEGGWTVSGGNGTSARIRARAIIDELGENVIGEPLIVSRINGGIKLTIDA